MARAPLQANRRRSGFTLIEMLVVLAIIAVLITLTAAAVMRTMVRQESANTKSELSRVKAAFEKAYRATADKYRNEPAPPLNLQPILASITANQAGGDRLRAQVIWTKLRLRRAFPMTFNEAVNPNDGNPVPPLSYYTTKLAALGYTAANVNSTPAQIPSSPYLYSPESSVCLLLALQRGEDGPGIQQSDIGPSTFFKDFTIATQSGSGQPITGLVDGWGDPLYFVRWPIFLNASNPANPNNYGLTGQPVPNPPGPAFNDADDPTGLLASTSWQGSPPFATGSSSYWFVTTLHGLARHTGGAPTTYKNFAIIASGGAGKGAGDTLGFNPYAVTVMNAGSPAATNPPVGSIDADDLLATLALPN